MEHLRNFALDALTGLEEVAHLETPLIFKHAPRRALPDFSAAPGDPRRKG